MTRSRGIRRPVPPVVVDGEVAYLQLTRGRVAIIDAVDVPLVEGYRWCWSGAYAQRRTNGRNHALHVALTGELHVDHANRNTLDNRRSNLRSATRTQNLANARKRDGTTSRFKGVHLQNPGDENRRRVPKWSASIQSSGGRRHIGSFTNEEDAARAYDKAAVELFGEFAATNESLGLFCEDAE